MKKLLAALLCVLVATAMMPAVAFASVTTQVNIGADILVDGEPKTYGQGTAILNAAEKTLTLDGVTLTNSVGIVAEGEFTVYVKGECTIGEETTPLAVSGIYMAGTGSTVLHVNMEEGSSLKIYNDEGNNLYSKSTLKISGPGTFYGNTESYPSLFAEEGIQLQDGVSVDIISAQNGMNVEKGEILIDHSTVNVQAGKVGIFANYFYDDMTGEEFASSITLKDSSVTIITENMQGMYAAGDVNIENTRLDITVTDKTIGEYGSEGYSVYSDSGIITVSGDNTVVETDDVNGLEGSQILINGGTVSLNSVEAGLVGWKGITISGGKIDIESGQSAILANNGELKITGTAQVNATSSSAEFATVRNVRDGGIVLDAKITIKNTGGNKPVEGVKRTDAIGIILGTNFEADGVKVYQAAEENGQWKSYFVSETDGTPITGEPIVVAPSSTTGGGGGIYYPLVQKPVIETDGNATVKLDSTGTTVTIEIAEGYELADVTVNGASKGAVTVLTGLKTGDKVVVTTKKIVTEEELLIEKINALKLVARSEMSAAKNKKAVKLVWYDENGADLTFLDGIEIYRSVKRFSGYTKKPIFITEKETYHNTAIVKGNKYYYKVRGYVVIQGEKVYTDFSKKAWRTVK